MKLQDLLRHIADNVESGRKSFTGLDHPFVADPHEKLFLYPEEFKLAPRTHVVNGFTVPAPEVDELTNGSAYYLCNVANPYWVSASRWLHSEFDLRLLRRGSVFLDREAAIANAKAEKSIDPYSEGEE